MATMALLLPRFAAKRWKRAAARAHQQTRQSISARVAGGSGAECGAARAGDVSRLSTISPAEESCTGESGHGTEAGGEAGGEVVLDAAFACEVRAADPGFACRTVRHILWS